MLELYPQYGYEMKELSQVNSVMAQDANASTSKIRRKVESGGDIWEDVALAYEKGRTVLKMTEAFIGPDKFQLGVRNYLETYKWKNAVASDLFSALAEASGKNLEPILASYLDQAGFPLLTVNVNSNGTLTLSQKRFRNAGADVPEQNWNVPVRLKVSDGKNVQTRVVVLDKESEQVEIAGKVDWVMPDQDGVGYYRWVVPHDMMMRIAKDPATTMSKRERTRFLGNARALLNAGEITGDEYLAIASSMASNPEPEILASVIDDLGSLKAPFVTTELEEPFSHYIRQTLAAARTRYGVEPRADDPESVRLLRPGLIAWLGGEGEDPEVITYCENAASAYMKDPGAIDATIAGSVLAVCAAHGDRARYEEFRARYEASTVPADKSRYLTALGKFEDPAIQDDVLQYALSPNIRPMDRWQLVSGLFNSEAGRDKLYAWMTKNYDQLAAGLPVEFVSYFPYFVAGCEQQRLDAARKFFDDPKHKVDGTEANLSKVSEAITDCLSLREREGKAVASYLKALAP
jgi:alanyl aminopeptidase